MYDVRGTRYDLKIPAPCAKGLSKKLGNTLPRVLASQQHRRLIIKPTLCLQNSTSLPLRNPAALAAELDYRQS